MPTITKAAHEGQFILALAEPFVADVIRSLQRMLSADPSSWQIGAKGEGVRRRRVIVKVRTAQEIPRSHRHLHRSAVGNWRSLSEADPAIREAGLETQRRGTGSLPPTGKGSIAQQHHSHQVGVKDKAK